MSGWLQCILFVKSKIKLWYDQNPSTNLIFNISLVDSQRKFLVYNNICSLAKDSDQFELHCKKTWVLDWTAVDYNLFWGLRTI